MSLVSSNLHNVTGESSDVTVNLVSSCSTVVQHGFLRTTLCYRDICSLSTLQEMEENPPPDFQLPCFPSWTTSQSVQANIPTSAPLAPRNGHEQPYWYRPHYIGWQYVTSGSQVTEQASFHQSSSAYHFTHRRSTGCHTTGCHASERHAIGCQFTNYYSKVTENAQGLPSGVAYDHSAFPKIVSVHSMGEESYNTLQKTTLLCGEEGGDTPNNHFSKSSLAIPATCNNDAASSRKITDHSISTILDLPSARNCSSFPVHNDGLIGSPAEYDCPKNETKVSLPSDEHDQGTEVRYSIAKDEEIKITEGEISSPNFVEGFSNPALQRQSSNFTLEEVKALEIPSEPTLQKGPLRITSSRIKENTLNLHRLREINKVQKHLKRELSERQETCFSKENEMGRKGIKIFASGSMKGSENPLNSPPVKKSRQAPIKEKAEREESMADLLSDEKRSKLNAEIKGQKSLGETLSSKKLKEDVPRDDFRMNVFEKLALLSEKRRCEDSTSRSSSLHDSDSQSSDKVKVKITHERSKDTIIEREDELHTFRSNSKRSAALGNDGESNEKIDILVMSDRTSLTDTTTARTIPNNWSSAYIYENLDSKNSFCLSKRKYGGEVSGEFIKRRCNSLPRKVDWKANNSLEEELSQIQESVDKDEEQLNIPLKTEVSCKGENVDPTPFLGIVNRNGNVGNPRLLSRPLSQSTIVSDPRAYRVYDDDTLQRNLELRQSKISDLLRKQEGLLEKLGSTPLPRK